MSDGVDPGPAEGSPQEGSEQLRPVVTRREFMAGAGAGLAVGAVVAGGIAVATRPAPQTRPTTVVTAPGAPAAVVAQPPAPVSAPGPAQAQPQAPEQPGALPLSMRRVDLNIDGVSRTVVVDVRGMARQAAAQIRTVARPMSLNAYKVDIAQNLIERTLLQALA